MNDEVSIAVNNIKGVLTYTILDLLNIVLTKKNAKNSKVHLYVKDEINFYFITPFMTLSAPMINVKADSIRITKEGSTSDLSMNFLLNVKSASNAVFEPLIEKLMMNATLSKSEGNVSLNGKLSGLLINIKPDMLEALLDISNIIRNKQTFRCKVSSLVINNRLGVSIKVMYEQSVYKVDDEIKSLDVSSGIVKTDLNMDFIELIGDEITKPSEILLQNFQAVLDRIELTEELKAISFSTEDFGVKQKLSSNSLKIFLTPDNVIDINLNVEGKFLTSVHTKEYKVLVLTTFLNGVHHIEVRPCLEIVNKTSHKFYVVLFKKTHDKGITRSSSLNQIGANETAIEKSHLLAIGSKKLKKDDTYLLPYMINTDNYFIKICEHFDNKPCNVYNINGLLKNKSASVSTSETVN